jgi:hypothetical protein
MAGTWADFTTGEVITEAQMQNVQDSLIFIFASESAANTALTNKTEGTIFFDTTADQLKAWDGSAWITIP